MIRVRDALTLSVTKLKTRRIRLAVMTIVSGLFFVLLVFASFIFTGVMNSIDRFSQEGLGDRYIVKVESIDDPDFGLYDNKEVIAEAKKADKKLVADKTATAKKLGIEYDPTTETLAVTKDENDYESVQELPHVAPILRKYRIERSKAFFEALEKASQQYNAVARHNGVVLYGQTSGGPTLDSPTVIPLKNNKEITLNDQSYGQQGFSTIVNGLTVLDDNVLNSFLLDNQNLAIGKDKSVPVVAPFSAVEEAIGLAPLSVKATSAEKLARLQEVRTRGAGVTFQVCIRNTASVDRQNQAITQADEIKKNKGNKDYIMPELILVTADKPCRDVVVSKDVRTADTKAFDLKQEKLAEQFGSGTPAQRLLRFRVAGITPDINMESGGFDIGSLVSSLVTSNLGSGWYVPLSAGGALPEYKTQIDAIGKIATYQDQILLEFEDAAQTKQFIDEQTCEPNYASFDDPYGVCRQNGKYFLINSYGSNSVALSQARKWFNDAFIRAALVIAALSAITMMGTVGKVIADSRRETAVFRAIGAKRLDIALIYVLYTLLLGCIIALFAFIGGFLLAQFVDMKYSSDVTVDALTIFNAQDLSLRFDVAQFNPMQMLQLLVIILAAAFVSAIIPLINNLKRNPIKDMRDER